MYRHSSLPARMELLHGGRPRSLKGASGDAMQEDESSKAAMQFAMGQMTGNLTSLINKGRANISAGAKKGSTDRPTTDGNTAGDEGTSDAQPTQNPRATQTPSD